jgi:hypothetical protein
MGEPCHLYSGTGAPLRTGFRIHINSPHLPYKPHPRTLAIPHTYMSAGYLCPSLAYGSGSPPQQSGKCLKSNVQLTVKRPGDTIITGTDNMPRKETPKANRQEEATSGQKAKKVPQLQMCPACREMTLYWDKCTNQGVCLSPGCRLSGR